MSNYVGQHLSSTRLYPHSEDYYINILTRFSGIPQLVSVIDSLEICVLQSGARKTGQPSRRTTWAQVSVSVQEIKQMQMQSTYWL